MLNLPLSLRRGPCCEQPLYTPLLLFQTPLCPAVCAGMVLGTGPRSPQAPLSVCLKSSRPLISDLFIIKQPHRANSFLQLVVGDVDTNSKIINIQISTICQDEFGFVSFQGVSLCSPLHFPVVLLNSQFSPAALQRSRIICPRLGTQWRAFGPIRSPNLLLQAVGRRGSSAAHRAMSHLIFLCVCVWCQYLYFSLPEQVRTTRLQPWLFIF